MQMNSAPLTPGYVFAAWPQLLVEDVAATVAYYWSTLGFGVRLELGDPPVYAIVERDQAVIHLMAAPPGSMRPNHHVVPHATDVYLSVEKAAALLMELRARGAKVVGDLADQPYGMREFTLEDLNGYRLGFGQELGGE
jgi:uncharacterized glyoxalase superfamily protein PhnB